MKTHTGKARSAECGRTEARSRLRTAQAYFEVAELVVGEQEQEEFLNVSAGLAVLAGIAASDALCCIKLRRRHRGEDHRGAAELVKQAVPDGPALATTLLRLLDLKDEAHYGVMIVAPSRTRDAVKWASRLVDRAQEEIER